MSSHWHIGMEVECIDDEDAEELAVGRKYTVISIFSDACGVMKGRPWSGVSIGLKEATSYTEIGLPHDQGFAASRFRPVAKRTTSIEVFRALLTPSQADLEELELADFILEHSEVPFQ